MESVGSSFRSIGGPASSGVSVRGTRIGVAGSDTAGFPRGSSLETIQSGVSLGADSWTKQTSIGGKASIASSPKKSWRKQGRGVYLILNLSDN